MAISTAKAQDTVCQKWSNLSKKNNKKSASRCISKSSTNGMEIIMEIDTFSNYSVLTLMNMNSMKFTTEKIVFDKKCYVRTNKGKWQTTSLEPFEMMNTYMPSLNLQNQIFNNCKQLDDEKVGNEICLVFETEIDKTVPINNGKSFSFKGRNKIWMTTEGLLLRMRSETSQNNITMTFESTFEYDNNIKIIEPVK